jgi:uncharacterized protein (DUF433 family)
VIIDADAVIDRYIDTSSALGDPADARLADAGVRIWVLMAYLHANDTDLERAASAYAVPIEAIEAAQAYYDRHRRAIDARLAQHASFFALAI